jgi:XapX domain-containing protein
MRLYLVSLGAGLLVGIIYSLLNVRSPAPPAVALVGLLGILAGEQILPLAKQVFAESNLAAALGRTNPVFSVRPDRHAQSMKSNLNSEEEYAHDQTNIDR